MSKLLAKVKIEALSNAALNGLVQASKAKSQLHLQDHVTMDGSLDERLSRVSAAFRKWCENIRGSDVYDYEWYWWSTTILSVYSDYLIFCVYSAGSYCYYKLDYTADAKGGVTITGDLEQVNVKLVLEALDISEAEGEQQSVFVVLAELEAQYQRNWSAKARKAHPIDDFGDPDNREYPISNQEDMDSAAHLIGKAKDPDAVKTRLKAIAKRKGLSIPDAWKDKNATETQMNTNQNQAGDDVTTPSNAVAKTVVSSPVNHDGDNPKVATSAETEADESGATTPITAGDVETSQVDHDGDNGAGKGPTPNSDNGVKTEMARTDAGYKGENPAEDNYGDKDKPYTQSLHLGNPAYLIQSTSFDSQRNSLCFIQSKQKVEKGGKQVLVIQGIATRADIINAEGVVYPLAVWEQNLPRMNAQAQAGKFLGKLEHPKSDQGLVDTAIKFSKFWLQGSDVWFEADVLPTDPHGLNLQTMLDHGVQIDMSTRGYGTALQGEWRGNKSVRIIQPDFSCVGIDAVLNGASTGSSVTTAEYQSTTHTTESSVNQNAPLSPAELHAQELRANAKIGQYRTDLVGACGLSEMGVKIYQQALDSGTTLEEIHSKHESLLPVLQSQFPAPTKDAQVQSATYSPTWMSKSDPKDLAPKTVGEMFDRLVSDLPDKWQGQAAPSNLESHFQSPRAACKRLLTNIARAEEGGFQGGRAALGLLALEQGRTEKAQDILEQSLASGATTAAGNVDPGGAPLSAPLIFPLVRRVFPKYIMGEIAAIQPMDRPEGKIFYKDAYRTNDPTTGDVDARIDLNTSSNPFNSSYSDNSTEGSAAQLIRLKLASITVSAYTKKLGADWSIEEMQDLKAYHGLDAAQELMGDVAREVAIEWNLSVLNDMAANATSSITTFGTGMPASGFLTQEQWDAYLWVYLQNMDNQIFSRRNGPMTHIVCGVDAALAMSKSMRGTFTIGGESGGDMELYPGTQFYGSVSTPVGTYKIFKTNFWGSGTTNGSLIMGIRRGQEWSDTAYVWAPYTDYVTPILTDPSDYSQKQGIVSRAAKQVVVGDAIGLVQVKNQVGSILTS